MWLYTIYIIRVNSLYKAHVLRICPPVEWIHAGHRPTFFVCEIWSRNIRKPSAISVLFTSQGRYFRNSFLSRLNEWYPRLYSIMNIQINALTLGDRFKIILRNSEILFPAICGCVLIWIQYNIDDLSIVQYFEKFLILFEMV